MENGKFVLEKDLINNMNKKYTIKELEAKFKVYSGTIYYWIKKNKLKAKLKMVKYPSGKKVMTWIISEDDWYEIPAWMRKRIPLDK